MKKLISMLLVITILVTSFIAPINVNAGTCAYELATLNSAGVRTDITCYTNYAEAKTAMLAYPSIETNVAVIYNINDIVINARYAVAKLRPDNVINLYPTASSSSKYTSISTSYGVDAAFIDYDIVNNRALIKISGYQGWINMGATNSIRINMGASNMRSSASTGASVIGVIAEGTVVPYSSKTNDETYTWYQVTYANQVGYVASQEGWTTEIVNTVYADIIPLSVITYTGIKINDDKINIRDAANTSGLVKGSATDGKVYQYYAKTTGQGYTWYKIKLAGVDAWIPSSGLSTTEVNYGLQTYYQSWGPTENVLHYFEYQTNGYPQVMYINSSRIPSFMNTATNADNVYYSFDGNYYYTSLANMLDDYRVNTYSRAINVNAPHYTYYMYLSARSKTNYLAYDFNKYFTDYEYTYPDNSAQYVNYDATNHLLSWIGGAAPAGLSIMANQGQCFVDAANTYGINALMMYGVAVNESAYGRSAIAFYKKNLFGIGAADSNPVDGARSYASGCESIIDFAKFTGSSASAYTNPTRSLYYGSHYGNKGSGMNVNYATDPYWGEKQAQNSYNRDLSYGLQDYKGNTIGVTKVVNVPVVKTPYSTGATIYTMKNNNNQVINNIPVVVYDKVYTTEGGITTGWYKVYTDAALDANQNIVDADYNFATSYGYVREDYLYVENHQPTITAVDRSVEQKSTFNYMTGVSAADTENGTLTNITYTGTVNTMISAVYPVTYTVEDSGNFAVTKTVNITVLGSNDPVISASDKSISQYTTFNPMTGITALDPTDGNITSSITISANTVDPNVMGSGTITYTVTNSLGLTDTKTITVQVLANQKPTINVGDKVITVNTVFNPLTGVTAADYEQGNVTSLVTVTANDLDVTKAGIYHITYSVEDAAHNVTTKTIKITVEDKVYINKVGDFYYNRMVYENNKLTIEGSLAMIGLNNIASTAITYDLIIKNNVTGSELILPLERWLTNHPTRGYVDAHYNYVDSWFKGSLDLTDIPAGEYTLYVRARSGDFESRYIFRNLMGKPMVRKATDTVTHRGYLFRNNNYKSTYPIELFVSDNGLITNVDAPHLSNMFNSYTTLNLTNGYLNLTGKSFNINGNYASGTTIERYLILENTTTHVRTTYNIGSVVGDDIPLRVSDGLSKVRGWFDTTSKVNLTTLPEGDYVVYIRTKSGTVDDYGELNDIFLRNIANPSVSTVITSVIVGDRSYTVSLNKNARYRLELNIRK